MESTKTNQSGKGQSKKTPTGIEGFDEISNGGLPKGRATILSGNTGCGKTLMSMEFLVNGAVHYNESGVFMTFEETREDLIANIESLQFDIRKLVEKSKIHIEYLEMDKSPIVQSGEFDLEGLFARLQHAIDKVGAKRVVLDSLDSIFLGYESITLRQEIKRLFKWLRDKDVTAIITAQLNNAFVAHGGVEQYVAECVIALDSRVISQKATRRMRIVKMRGSFHGINEYPFVIGNTGISVLPLISILQDHVLTTKRISTGIQELDGMLDGKGFYRGSSILVSGSAGTGKTSIAMSLVQESCKKNIRSLYCAFEESASQVSRNMRSIGLDAEPYVKSGTLRFYASRPTLQNFELHLIFIKKIIEDFKPEIIVLDPVTNLMSEGVNTEIREMLTYFVDYLKLKDITTLFTAAITPETNQNNPSDEGISSMVDTWILLRDIENNNEHNRGMYVLKSRGMNHSTQVREFVISSNGIELLPIYIGDDGILTGSAKLEHTIKREEEESARKDKIENEKALLERKRKVLDDHIRLLKETFETEQDELIQRISQNITRSENRQIHKKEIESLRNRTDSSSEKKKNRNK